MSEPDYLKTLKRRYETLVLYHSILHRHIFPSNYEHDAPLTSESHEDFYNKVVVRLNEAHAAVLNRARGMGAAVLDRQVTWAGRGATCLPDITANLVIRGKCGLQQVSWPSIPASEASSSYEGRIYVPADYAHVALDRVTRLEPEVEATISPLDVPKPPVAWNARSGRVMLTLVNAGKITPPRVKFPEPPQDLESLVREALAQASGDDDLRTRLEQALHS